MLKRFIPEKLGGEGTGFPGVRSQTGVSEGLKSERGIGLGAPEEATPKPRKVATCHAGGCCRPRVSVHHTPVKSPGDTSALWEAPAPTAFIF